jgi:hypothetical protein
MDDGKVVAAIGLPTRMVAVYSRLLAGSGQ